MSRRNTVRKARALGNRIAAPLCGREIGPSVDIGVRRHVAACSDLLDDCRRWLAEARSGEFGAECQRKLILNLGGCLQGAAFGMTILVDHDAWVGALVLERSALEYYGKAAYFAKHVDHATWVVAVERIQVLIERAATAEERIPLSRQLSSARRAHIELAPESRLSAGLAPFHQVKITDMIREGVGIEALRRYRVASAVLHGDLLAGTLSRRPAAATNAALLHVASGMISMCNLMLSWLDKAPRRLTEHVLEAEQETYRLSQRYGDAYLIDVAFEPDDDSEVAAW